MRRNYLVGTLTISTIATLTILGWVLVSHRALAVRPIDVHTAHYQVNKALVPRITVIVDNSPALSGPTGIALNSTATVAWVTEEAANDGRLVRVDLASNAITPVATGLNDPGHLVVSGTLAFVAGNMGTLVTLMRIDLSNGTMISVSDELGGGLSGVAVNSALTEAHVVNYGSGVLSRVDVDLSSPTFKQVSEVVDGLSGPRDLDIDTGGTIAYVTEQNAGRLVTVDIDPVSPSYGAVVTVAAGMNGPRGLTLDPTCNLAYIAQEWAGKLSCVDLSTGVVTDVISGLSAPREVTVDWTQKWAWVTVSEALVAVDIDPGSPTYGTQVDWVDGGPPLDGARGLYLNDDETTAYIVEEFSGHLSRVDVDPASLTFGQTEQLAVGLDIPVDVVVDADEQFAYVAREQGPSRGVNVVSRVNLASGKVLTVTDAVGHPVDIAFALDLQAAYVVDLGGDVNHVTLPTGTLTTTLTGLTNPFGLGLAPDDITAYIVTEPASPSFPPGDLITANLTTGDWSVIANDIISGATSIRVNQTETRAYFTQFGLEGGCTGKLSWVDISPLSATYLDVTDILSDLCGPHDLYVRADERQFYVVLVDGKQFIRVDLLNVTYLPLVLKSY